MQHFIAHSDEKQHISKELYHSPLDWALTYARMGWPVIPLHTSLSSSQCSCNYKECCSIGKHPRTFKGLKDATTNEKTISWWWNQWPHSNVGILTGGASQLVVIDVDPRHGGDRAWTEFISQKEIPHTLKSITGGGGFHLYFKSEKKFKNRSGVLAGVDVRGEGGYIVAPGSVHSSQKKYLWETDFSTDLIVSLPSAIEKLISGDHKKYISFPNEKKIPCGKRNTTLTSVAGLLRKHGIEEQVLNKTLSEINQSICSTPLNEQEISTIAKSISKYEVTNEIKWGQLKVLPDLKLTVPSLNEQYIPSGLQPWIADIGERMQVPLEFIAAPVIVSLSSIIGRQIGIFPKQKDDWFVIPNLWGAVIARPGFFKSPAIAEALKPLEALTKEARLNYESGKILVQAKEELLKAKLDGLKETVKKTSRKGNFHELDSLRTDLEETLKEIEKNVIFEKRFKTNDATVEKLACLLNENPNGLLLARDELSGWLKTLQKSGREGDREFYLEAWNGYGSFTVDRIGRGTLHVPALCLAILGGLQPSKIDSYVNQASSLGGDDGLLQRFQILVYPEITKKWRNIDRRPNQVAFNTVKVIFRNLSNLKINKPSEYSGNLGLRFSLKAQELFNEWRGDLETRLRTAESNSPVFESHLAKYRSLIPSLALIFHLVSNCSHGSVDLSDEVQIESLQLAIQWSRFLEAHATKVYSAALFPNVRAAHVLAGKIANQSVKDKDSMRSIYNHHWSLLNTIEKLETAISVLEDANWVKVETVKIANTTSDILRINPSLGSSELLEQFR